MTYLARLRGSWPIELQPFYVYYLKCISVKPDTAHRSHPKLNFVPSVGRLRCDIYLARFFQTSKKCLRTDGKKGTLDLVNWLYDITKEEIQAGLLAVLLEAPLNKQAGYHITNIYLTLLQKVFCRGRELFLNLFGWPISNLNWYAKHSFTHTHKPMQIY